MAERSKDAKNPLSEAAHAKRGARGGGAQQCDRTTLNLRGAIGEAEQEAKAAPPDALGEELVGRGLISRHQLFNALNESYRTGAPLRAALLALQYITEDVLQREGL